MPALLRPGYCQARISDFAVVPYPLDHSSRPDSTGFRREDDYRAVSAGEVEQEHPRLKKLVADQALDNTILQEARS